MKRIGIIAFAFFCIFSLSSHARKDYTDALSLTVVGKYTGTAHPWDRLDAREGMSTGEMGQARMCAGMAVAFSTNSKSIGVRVVWRVKAANGGNMGPISARGFDLYMLKDEKWLWAGNGFPNKNTPGEPHEVELIPDCGSGEKHCLVYLPLFSQIESLDIVTAEGSWLEADSQPFKGRIAVWGSSYTQGSGAGRCAMTWEAQLSRATGYNFINLGFSGNCKLQPYFAEALLDAEPVDAFVFDAFSNPTPQEVQERLEPFIQRFVKERPGIPLIFLQTIRREKRNFSASYDAREHAKRTTAEELMQQMVNKYPNVYWINTTNATSPTHEATSDGSHPDSYGYTLWMESVKEPIQEILAK
ncbi:MAG: SGNH/GDSL hydrolase family protein [Bacteroidales bacterium]|nr:SGNH/GDSL hydrolase family protein [Bacteroidales bacterium]